MFEAIIAALLVIIAIASAIATAHALYEKLRNQRYDEIIQRELDIVESDKKRIARYDTLFNK